MTRGRSNGDTTIGAVILAALTVGMGIFILGVASGWLGATLQSSTNEANRAILLVKTSAQLSFEAVNFTSRERSIILRNIADVPVIVTRIEILTPGGALKASYPSTGFTELAELLPSGNATLSGGVIPLCATCLPLETLRLRVWYVASALFNEENPVLSADEMRYVETVFVYPPGGVAARCPLPPNWMTVDVIDPVTYSDTGKIPSQPNNRIHARFPYASSSATVSVDIQVINASGAYGFATRNVPTIGNEMYSFTGSFGGFQTPLRIHVLAAGFNVLQREWRLGGIPWKAHASGVTLWSNAEKMVDVVEVELGVNDLVGGRYRITVNLYDCNGELITSRFVITNVPRGIFTDSVFVDVPPILLMDIARIDVLVEEY
ncbi:MAG: hypothetical protein RMJ28_06625 [Nitrososphaerota archaeon]|nr:hypothetical protein [Candidatus Calditenuaceae archaeon]MDW8073889.1 hypothetical protein [Nitrososphaerota archaeon]